ncbi:MAG: hypothetical protein ABI740_02925 [Alphaproteobacteria bacterium]
MFGKDVKSACVALAIAAAFGLAPVASAEKAPKSPLARDALSNVPVFFIAGADGLPAHEDGGSSTTYYLTRAQASIAVGLARADRATAGGDTEELHVEASNLGDTARLNSPRTFVRPISHVDAAASVPGVPLFMVRDKEGTPFTVRDSDGRRRVFFYLSETDAEAFVERVLKETSRRPDDMQLSIVSLDPVLDTILTSTDPLVQNWTILSSAETRMDADYLKSGPRSGTVQAQLAPARHPE